MRRALAVALVGVGLALAVYILWPRRPPDDEALVRAAIADMARCASEKDLGGILEYVSERYQGEGGTRQELKGYLLGYVLRSDWVTAVPARVQVEVQGTNAKASFVILLARGPAANASAVQPEALAGSHRIEAGFAKEGGIWRVVSATRRDASPSDWLD